MQTRWLTTDARLRQTVVTNRILASLRGIASGDAIGKQTETLSRGGVLRWYPEGVRGFEGLPGSVIPRYPGNTRREWRIGETTDDTERTIAVARAILQDGNVESAILLAANIGGDSDSVASIAGAILGARSPDTVNDEWHAVVEMVNDHGLVALRDDLSRLRR